MIDFDAADFQQVRRNRGIPVTRGDFPENEVWDYPSLGRHTYFLFVRQRRGGYRVGTVNDLLPRRLRQGSFPNNDRGQALGDFTLSVLRYIHAQLALVSSDFSSRYTAVSDYVALREEAALSARGRGRRADPLPSLYGSVDSAVQSALTANRIEDDYNADARDRELPASQSPTFEGAPGLDVRVSRFRSSSGGTYALVDWRSEPPAGSDGEGEALTVDTVAVVALDSSYRPFYHRTYGAGAGTDTLAVVGTETPFHVAVQRDVYAGGAAAGFAVRRADSLLALRSGQGLEVSDLRPVHSVTLEPYPSVRASPDAPLSLYFEIYGLSASRGNFRVEYEVAQRRRGSVFRREREETKSGRLISQVGGDRAVEYLILNTAEWVEADEVEVEVEVSAPGTDSVKRRLLFQMH